MLMGTMSTLARIRAALGRHRRLTVLGTVAVLAVVSLVTLLLARDTSPPAIRAEAPSTTTTTATTTTTTAKPRPPVAPLTGLAGDFDGRLDRPALVVKIDNVERARPHAGLGKADIVIEEPVEGGLTRLAAVFHSRDARVVGPVRSVRTTDLELLPLLGRPLFASSGGNQGVIPQLHAANVVDIGANVSSVDFYRSGRRPAPHNLFTSTLALYDDPPESPPPPGPVFRYLDRGEKLAGKPIPVGGIALRFGGPEVSRFTWDAGSDTWLRSQRGTPHVLIRGERVAPDNVVVLEIGYDRSGRLGRSVPHGVVHGKGRAVVLTEGQAVEGTWTRPTLGDPLKLTTGKGEAIELTPGQTFVELVPSGGWAFV
jgi:hypothetical protein